MKSEPQPAAIQQDDSPETSIDHLQTLSPTRASNFKQCPQLFKFRDLDRLPEPTSIYQARGSAIHLALEHIFEHPPPERTREMLVNLFHQAWEQMRTEEEYASLFETPEAEQEWQEQSLDTIDNYLNIEDPTVIQPIEREMDITEPIGDMVIRGIIDRMEEGENGELVITDYKTGRAPPERYSMAAFFALKIYALLIRRRMGRTASELRLMYLGDGVVYALPINDQVLNGIQKQLEALWTAIERGLERKVFPPRVSPLCDWCSFQSICPAFANDDDSPNQ